MLSFRNNFVNIFNHVKYTFKIKSQIENPDLVIICKNGEKVLSHTYLFGMFSSNMRSMCEHVQNITLLLPSFKNTTVEQVIKLMMMDWEEEEEWHSEVVELLHAIGIHVGRFYPRKEITDSIDMKKFILELKDIKIEVEEEENCEISDNNVETITDHLGSNDDKIISETEKNLEDDLKIGQIKEIGEKNITDNEEFPAVAQKSLEQLRNNKNNEESNTIGDLIEDTHANMENVGVEHKAKNHSETTFDIENIKDATGEIITERPKSKDEIICPICGKVYKGQSLSYQLKIHIGFHHFMEDIMTEYATYFQDIFCNVCKKNFNGDRKKKVHLILNHSEVSNKIRDVANKAYDIPSVEGNLINLHKNSSRHKQFVCSICNLQYKRTPSHVVKHMKEKFRKARKDFFRGKSGHCKACDMEVKGGLDVHLLFKHEVLNKEYNWTRNKVIGRKDKVAGLEEKEENKLIELRNRLHQHLVQDKEKSLLQMNLLEDGGQPNDEEN